MAVLGWLNSKTLSWGTISFCFPPFEAFSDDDIMLGIEGGSVGDGI